MTRLLSLIAAALLLLSPLTASAETRYVLSPGDGYVNLSGDPSAELSILARMYNGEQLWVLGARGNWRQVRRQDGTVGWIYASYLTPDMAVTDGTFFINSPGDGFLNLRTGPGMKYGVVRRMAHRSSAEVLGRSGKWLSVLHESGATGWAHQNYFTSSEPPMHLFSGTAADCQRFDSGATEWFIRLYKCGDASVAAYPGCIAKWRTNLCGLHNNNKGFMNLLRR
ncbi:MAG: hypothetical protein CR993_08840 [Rhodobacterales bacterium]|nr:MAG: hypothetical protein CR993_08840 [Rhodobacterales bacterium]